MRRLSFILILALISEILCSQIAEAKDYWVTVDDHDRPLPTAGYYYNASGGDRGLMSASSTKVNYSWDNQTTYTATVTEHSGLWGWHGLWYSLIHLDQDNLPLNFSAIFGPYIKPAFQGEVQKIRIGISNLQAQRPDFRFRVELKNTAGGVICYREWESISGGAVEWVLEQGCKGQVEQIALINDRVVSGDSISIDYVRMLVTVPDLPIEEEAFLWSFGWLMANYDATNGIFQDRSNFNFGLFENVSASAKAAKVAVYAYKMGMILLTDLQQIVTDTAATLINVVPRGPAGLNTLWPHYTTDGGRKALPPGQGGNGSEWASGDTLYAALDIIAALEMIGDPNGQIPALKTYLEAINWDGLLIDGYLSHGYSYEGSLIPWVWRGFGMETVGVNWAYAAATGNITAMDLPPSDNGSGFIDNAHYPLVLSGIDYLGNDWTSYRQNMADLQISWYHRPASANPFFSVDNLFGLSAAEDPEDRSYQPYGVGGLFIPPLDGDHDVIVLHYSAMIADIRPMASTSLWQKLRDRAAVFQQNDRIIISPLNNMESLKVNPLDATTVVNYLKGSWNLALQAEGWALANPTLKTELKAAVCSNSLLKRGYKTLTGTQLVNAFLFYNNSSFDGFNGAALELDDNAIATDKEPLLLCQKGSFENYSSYSGGINGVMIDMQYLAESENLTLNDFLFKVGNSNNPSEWKIAPQPISVNVRAGAGSDGSDRITLIWENGAIKKEWLQITVLATPATGLACPEVFFFGNAVGETGNSAFNALVNATDQLLIRKNASGLSPQPVTNRYDIDRNRIVNATDVLIARNNASGLTPLLLITPDDGACGGH